MPTMAELFENAIDCGNIAVIPNGFNSKNPLRRVVYTKMKNKYGNTLKEEGENLNTESPTEEPQVKNEPRVKSSDILDNIQRKIDIINKDIVVVGAQVDDNTIIQFFTKPKYEEQLNIELEQLIGKNMKLNNILEELDNLYTSYRIYKVSDTVDKNTVVKPRDHNQDAEELGIKNKTVYDKKVGNSFGAPTTVTPLNDIGTGVN